MNPSLVRFLQGAPPPRPNGLQTETLLARVESLERGLGAPECPFAAQATALWSEFPPWAWRRAFSAYQAALDEFVERATLHGMLPEAWMAPQAGRQFGPYRSDTLRVDDTGYVGALPAAVAFAAVGAPTLSTAEALLREAQHHHWDPAVRDAPIHWEVATHNPYARDFVENDVARWLHQWDEVPQPGQRRTEMSLPDEVRGDLWYELDQFFQAEQGTGRMPPPSVNATTRVEAAAVAADALLVDSALGAAANWVPYLNPIRRSVPRTLLWTRLWLFAFLEQAALRTTMLPASRSGAGVPSRGQLLAFYAPLVDLCRLGFLPGAITPEGARVLLVAPSKDGFPDRARGRRWL